MEKPCLLGLDSLFGNAACDDLGRMQRKVRGEIVPLVLEDAVKQVESPVTSSDVEERLELNCGVVRECEAADATGEGGGGHAAVKRWTAARGRWRAGRLGRADGARLARRAGRARLASSEMADNMSPQCLG